MFEKDLAEISERLHANFAERVLEREAHALAALAVDAASPLPLFVLEHVLRRIAAAWHGRPLSVEEALGVKRVVLPAIDRLIVAMQADTANLAAEEAAALVKAYASTRPAPR